MFRHATEMKLKDEGDPEAGRIYWEHRVALLLLVASYVWAGVALL